MYRNTHKNIQALILAAGYGTRMLPLTLKTPKPLVKLLDKPLIMYILEQIKSNNIDHCYINSHHLHNKIKRFVKEFQKENIFPKIKISYEKNILETGGAIKNINLTNNNSLLVINADSIIINENDNNIIKKLKENFKPKKMDALLLLDNFKNSIGYEGTGDFVIKEKSFLSSIERKSNSSAETYAFTGWQILNPQMINKINIKRFSLNYFYDNAIKNNRLWGIINEDKWLHIGTINALKDSEKLLEEVKK